MNEYLNAIHVVRRGVWKHAPVKVDLSSRAMTVRSDKRRWILVSEARTPSTSLWLSIRAAHTEHEAWLSLSRPLLIDIPGDFAGERIGDREDFIAVRSSISWSVQSSIGTSSHHRSSILWA